LEGLSLEYLPLPKLQGQKKEEEVSVKRRRSPATNCFRGGILINRTLILPILTSAAFLFGGSDDAGVTRTSSPVVVEIDGTKFTLADFEQKRPTALFQARNTFYDAERKALEEFADQFLLDRQAKKENVTVDQLLERHVNSTILSDPSDDALRVYYEGVETTEPFESARPKILEHIREKRISRAKKAYLESLRDQAKISIVMPAPRAPISLAGTPVRGAANAPVTLVEYADYECPYCQQAEPDLDRLQAEFKGKLAFGYKDLPLPMHAHAQKAAEAAQCAGLQNKYWEFHDQLLKTKELELPQLKAQAKQVGLESKAFDECLDSGKGAGVIHSNLEEAQKLGLTGTPGFFLNGRFINGMPKYEQLRQMVQEELNDPSTQQQRAARQ
jgi:protein-disulfide isomerase